MAAEGQWPRLLCLQRPAALLPPVLLLALLRSAALDAPAAAKQSMVDFDDDLFS